MKNAQNLIKSLLNFLVKMIENIFAEKSCVVEISTGEAKSILTIETDAKFKNLIIFEKTSKEKKELHKIKVKDFTFDFDSDSFIIAPAKILEIFYLIMSSKKFNVEKCDIKLVKFPTGAAKKNPAVKNDNK